MKIIKHSEWADTQHILHMVLQMMGKMKLQRMPAQPEWGHVILDITAKGFTTGLIPSGDKSFDITVNLSTGMVYAHCTDGGVAGFPFYDSASVSEYYQDFGRMLADIGQSFDINAIPQEVATTVPFDQQTEKMHFDDTAANVYFQTAVFARNALLAFSAPFRGKKMQPSMFWGTFDLTTVLFSGLDHPFPGDGLIEKVAFDEKFVEFGYWPGDAVTDDPSFFVLPYPFLTDTPGGKITPDEAFFSPEKMEYFLPLKHVLDKPDPQKTVVDFCCDAFDAIAAKEDWEYIDWFKKPLLIP